MKTGLNINELASRLLSDRSTLKDYIGNTGLMSLADDGQHFRLQNGELKTLGVRRLAHQQIADKVGIPFKYYERMQKDQPDLLATNVNRWFSKEPAPRLVRTINGDVRAFLSDSYRPLDNVDVGNQLLGPLVDSGLEIVSAQITETRLYIQARNQRVSGEVKVGDVVQAGLVITNSEVGCGSLSISELDFRLRCLNGMVGESITRKTHVGAAMGNGITFAQEVFSTATRIATDRAFWLQAKDAMKAALSPERFNKRIEKMKRAASIDIGAPDKAIEAIREVIQITDGESSGILGHLARGGDMTLWGLANATTAMAHDIEDYDRAFEFEQMGRKVLELPQHVFSNN